MSFMKAAKDKMATNAKKNATTQQNSNTRIKLSNLKIANSEGIQAFIKSQEAYFENGSRDVVQSIYHSEEKNSWSREHSSDKNLSVDESVLGISPSAERKEKRKLVSVSRTLLNIVKFKLVLPIEKNQR